MILGFPILLATAILGTIGAPWWVPFCSAALLTLLAVLSSRAVSARLVAIGHGEIMLITLGLNFAMSFVVATVALLIGRLGALLV